MQPVARLTCKRKAPTPPCSWAAARPTKSACWPPPKARRRSVRPGALARSSATWSAIGLPVNDRTLLILEIFAQRAQPRRQAAGGAGAPAIPQHPPGAPLVHLERQQGGIGGRGGPGETQIELDRRMIGEAIKRTKERLRRSSASARPSGASASGARLSTSRWWATPTPASPRCSMPWSRRAPTRPTSCLPRWTPPRASSTWARRRVGLAVGHRGLHPRPAARLVEAFEATLQEAADADCCCTWWTPPTPPFPSRWPRCSACCTKSAPRTCRSCWCSTSWTR
jgi:GTP-binding protein HflX